MHTLPLSELASFIRRVFALNLPEPVWVSAELAQVSESRGHTWLTLVEKDNDSDTIHAQLEAVIWQSTRKQMHGEYGLPTVRGVLQVGMAVRLRVTASFHERFGLKLIVDDLDPTHTLGVLEERRQQTLAALQRDGLLDRNASLPFPELPLRLAVISAETAAGLADFTDQLGGNSYGYAFRWELFHAAMQGAQTTEEIGRQLRRIKRSKSGFDAIVLVRGGGSKTDLSAFDEEELCRLLAAAPLPVLAGIGHEVDRSVVDRVVHRSCKTPTAAAVYLVETVARRELHVLQLGRSIHQLSQRANATARREVDQCKHRLHSATSLGLQKQYQQLTNQQRRLWVLAADCLRATHRDLTGAERLLSALRPETTLARGFALVSQQGRLITDADDYRREVATEIRLHRGRISIPPG
jgi:exodeoxyribonuclease VII large subunit